MARKLQLACAWSFVPFAVLFGGGFCIVAGFIPPPHPSESALQIQRLYKDNLTGIRIGMVMTMLGVVLLVPWGVVVAMQTRRIEPENPILGYVQIGAAVMTAFIGVMIAISYGVAAFRPTGVSPDVTRMLNDAGWFFFLFDWPPVGLWYAAVGLAILRDHRDSPIFPRWAGYLSFWAVALSTPSSLIIFFKHGAFGYNGLIALYLPLAVLFAWFIVITWLVIRAILNQAQTQSEAPAPAPSPVPAPA
ncbi:MAG: hypothetical protein ACYDHH_03390 [Solirubrobacteraceae bacterium]